MVPVIDSIHLPTKRPFSWRALWILVALQLLGNLLSIPTLKASNLPVGSPLSWILWTAISIPMIALALFLGGRIGLGAPLLEGYIGAEERRHWVRTIVAFSVLVAAAATPLILLLNQNITPEGYPAPWKLILAAVDAGVQEEIFNRLLLMTGIAWIGSLVWREADGRPTRTVVWIAILISAILFGWAHVDDKLSIPGVPVSEYLILISTSALYGVVFGWSYWKLGIECAILVHFTIDAFAAGIIIPAYISNILLVQILTFLALILAGGISWIILNKSQPQTPEIK